MLNKHTLAQYFAKKHFELVFLNGKFYQKGSHGPLDATDDIEEIKSIYDKDDALNPALVTGQINDICFLEIIIPKNKDDAIVNGAKPLNEILKLNGENPKKFVMRHMKFMANNTHFLLPFKLDGKKISSKMAIAPGINLYSENQHVYLPGSEYPEGYRHVYWELHGVDSDNFDPSEDYFGNISVIPEWLEELSKTQCPEDLARSTRMTEQKAISDCTQGFTGDNAKDNLHDALCVLQAFGVERNVILDAANVSAQNSTPEIDSKWAKSCAWYVMTQYQQLNINKQSPTQDKSALENSF